MIKWINKEYDSWEGVFKSRIFRDDEGGDELAIYIEHNSIADYSEKCVEALNSLSDDVVREICKGIISTAEEYGELPEINDALDILNYCWFTAVYVSVPTDSEQLEYVVEGEGDWGDVIGFVMKDNKPVYIGVDYLS